MVVADTLTNLIPHGGLPYSIIGGGLVGFVLGWFAKKLVKVLIIGIGLVCALLAYLEYQKMIRVDWNVVKNQTSTFLEHSSQKIMTVVNQTSTDLSQHNLNHGLDVAFPIFGSIGFVPGFLVGLARG
jgi:uncharacterized membrane protein (Fun14 family)